MCSRRGRELRRKGAPRFLIAKFLLKVRTVGIVSGIFLKGHWSWIGPVCAVVLSDLTLNPFYGTNFLESFTLVSLLAYFGIFVIGKRIRRSPKMLPLLGGAVGSALLFHGLTCGFAWIANPAYMKTFSGFVSEKSVS